MNKNLMIKIEYELNSIKHTLENIKSNGLPHERSFKIIFNSLIKRNKDLQDMVIKHHEDIIKNQEDSNV